MAKLKEKIDTGVENYIEEAIDHPIKTAGKFVAVVKMLGMGIAALMIFMIVVFTIDKAKFFYNIVFNDKDVSIKLQQEEANNKVLKDVIKDKKALIVINKKRHELENEIKQNSDGKVVLITDIVAETDRVLDSNDSVEMDIRYKKSLDSVKKLMNFKNIQEIKLKKVESEPIVEDEPPYSVPRGVYKWEGVRKYNTTSYMYMKVKRINDE